MTRENLLVTHCAIGGTSMERCNTPRLAQFYCSVIQEALTVRDTIAVLTWLYYSQSQDWQCNNSSE